MGVTCLLLPQSYDSYNSSPEKADTLEIFKPTEFKKKRERTLGQTFEFEFSSFFV